MSNKHKEAILEVLKKSGPLQGSALKERTTARLHIENDSYPKSTYLHHLEQLIDELKIEFKVEDNKRIYFIKNFEHDVPGGLILENLEGRITSPKILKAFNPRIAQGIISSTKPDDFQFYFEFNSTNICLSIHKDAVPFKLHISRKTDKDINTEVVNQFGSRTITLELPIAKISSHKNKDHSGHLLLEISDSKKMTILELGATNPASVLKIKNLTPEFYFKELTLLGAKTVHNDWVEKNKEIFEKNTLKNDSKIETVTTAVIMLTGESSLFVF